VILDAHGVRIELPAGWSGHLFERDRVVGLHAANYPIALDDTATFGDASTARMGAGSAFVALVEYRPGDGLEPGHGLYAPRRIALPLDPTGFSTHRLAHPRPGQTGAQQFFTAAGRPFCVYIALAGDRSARRRPLDAVNRALGSLAIQPRPVEDSAA
jgi:hypothetical protein